MATLAPLRDFFRDRLWRDEGLNPWSLFGYLVLRVLTLSGRNLVVNRSMVRASALAYTTILALIPLSALLFAILKALGIQRLIATHVMDTLAPGSRDFALQVLDYIEKTQVTSLGIFGVGWLLGALVLVMTNVERAFNQTWHVSQTRPFSRKVSDYLSIFLLFPILMGGAASITSAVLSSPEIHGFLSLFLPEVFYTATSSLFALGIVWAAFTFIYLVMPNAQVNLRSALIGGIVGGTLWQIARLLFIWFQGFATYYNAIYGALYNALFLVIWMFWSWLIILFGTEVAHAHQHLDRLKREYRLRQPRPEPVDEYLALAALAAIGARFDRGGPPLAQDELGQLLQSSDHLAAEIVTILKRCDLVVEVARPDSADSPQFHPKLPLDRLTLKEVLHCLRQARWEALAQVVGGEPPLAAMLKRLLESSSPTEWQTLSLQELVDLLEKERAGEEPKQAAKE